MPDRLTPAQRHYCMSRIRSKDTTPEKKVRQWLWRHGYRYRLHVKSVPGKPDIVMRTYRTAIFVNGCFWHGHNADTHGRASLQNSDCCKIPESNRDFWVNKIRRNQERDQRNHLILQENGWQVLVVWECMLTPSKLEHTMQEVAVLLNQNYLNICNIPKKAYRIPNEATAMAAEESPAYGKTGIAGNNTAGKA